MFLSGGLPEGTGEEDEGELARETGASWRRQYRYDARQHAAVVGAPRKYLWNFVGNALASQSRSKH